MPDRLRIPAAVVRGGMVDLLFARAARLARRREYRMAAPGKIAGRAQMAARLREQGRHLQGLAVCGEVDATLAGLLLAWAGGHQPALVDAEDMEPRLCGLGSEDYVGAAQLVLGGREE